MARQPRKPRTAKPELAETPVQPVGKTVDYGQLIEWNQKSFKGLSGDKWAATRDALTDARNVVGALTRIVNAEQSNKPFPTAAAKLIETIANKRGWSQIVRDGKAIYTRKVN